jgi:biopolymer transport protein TolR
MARTFRRHRQSHPISELNLTNLIDLGFVLLIIFMIATPLIQQEQTIPLNLPLESPSVQQKQDPDTRFQVISIDRNGRFFFGTTPVTLPELRIRLAELATDPRPPVIRIRADLTLQWQQVVTVMDELKRQNLSRITFDTQTGG